LDLLESYCLKTDVVREFQMVQHCWKCVCLMAS